MTIELNIRDKNGYPIDLGQPIAVRVHDIYHKRHAWVPGVFKATWAGYSIRLDLKLDEVSLEKLKEKSNWFHADMPVGPESMSTKMNIPPGEWLEEK